MNKNVFKYVILILIIIFLIILYKVLFPSINFELVGYDEIKLSQNTKYVDSGYNAYLNNGTDLSSYVTVINNVNINKVGEYEIIYQLKYRLVNKEIVRKVKVIANGDNSLTLIGDSPYYLLKGDEYIEWGCNVENNAAANINIISNVDSSVVGNYIVQYSYIVDGHEEYKYRDVIVYDLYCITNVYPEYYSPDGVSIEIIVADNGYYDHMLLPDLELSREKYVNYSVLENGIYNFLLFDIFGNQRNFMVDVNNIVDSYTCNGLVNYQGSSLSLNGIVDDSIDSFTWNVDGKTYNSQKIFINKTVNNAFVTIKYNDNSEYRVDCNIKNNLLYRFKYDVNNTKPFISCNSYTYADKIRLDSLLKQVINEAGGSGTRAGAVAAARFLVGGLDYKIPYLGPKNSSVDPSHVLGIYEEKGLNIGNDISWGCRVHGWTQGIDCTGFVYWVFKQIDFKDNLYSTSNTYNVREVIDSVQVGDTLLAPKKGASGEFQHIGIIIGIDDRYFYVAESTTGSVNAVVVTKMEKYNMPSGDAQLSIVKKVKYPREGNVTNMWME